MEDTEEYMLKWNSHNVEVITEFHELCREEKFTDVTLAADDITFEAHRIVLSACSPYFRKLLTITKSKHPVIFLKDVTPDHVALLLRYMYTGQIAVKKDELSTFLRTADHLRIRGLAMTSPTSAEPPVPRKDVVLPSREHEEEEHRKIIAPPALTKCSRKSYMPKKIRHSGESRISDSSSPSQLHSDSPGLSSVASPVPQRRNSGTLPTILETAFNNNCKDSQSSETGLDMMEHEGTATISTEEENEEDQPVDFSQTMHSHHHEKPQRDSILSNYLKTGKLGHKQILQHSENGMPKEMEDNEAASISKAAGVLAQSWLEQSIPGLQTELNEKSNNRKMPPLQETLGIDIADRLRSHFLSNLPPSSLDWLNSSSPNGKMNNASSNADRNQNRTSTGPVSSATGKPSVSCEICGKKLADPSSLYRHRKIHSGDKPHKCPFCSRRFIQRYNMKQHIKTHRMERMSEAEKEEYLPRPRTQDVAN